MSSPGPPVPRFRKPTATPPSTRFGNNGNQNATGLPHKNNNSPASDVTASPASHDQPHRSLVDDNWLSTPTDNSNPRPPAIVITTATPKSNHPIGAGYLSGSNVFSKPGEATTSLSSDFNGPRTDSTVSASTSTSRCPCTTHPILWVVTNSSRDRRDPRMADAEYTRRGKIQYASSRSRNWSAGTRGACQVSTSTGASDGTRSRISSTNPPRSPTDRTIRISGRVQLTVAENKWAVTARIESTDQAISTQRPSDPGCF